MVLENSILGVECQVDLALVNLVESPLDSPSGWDTSGPCMVVFLPHGICSTEDEGDGRTCRQPGAASEGGGGGGEVALVAVHNSQPTSSTPTCWHGALPTTSFICRSDMLAGSVQLFTPLSGVWWSCRDCRVVDITCLLYTSPSPRD